MSCPALWSLSRLGAATVLFVERGGQASTAAIRTLQKVTGLGQSVCGFAAIRASAYVRRLLGVIGGRGSLGRTPSQRPACSTSQFLCRSCVLDFALLPQYADRRQPRASWTGPRRSFHHTCCDGYDHFAKRAEQRRKP